MHMKNINMLQLFVKESLKQNVENNVLFESHRRSSLVKMLIEATARIFNLDQKDILQLLNDILGGQPVLTYTEKLAGTFFEVKITNGNVGGRYKDTKNRGGGFGYSDESGVASILQRTDVFEGQNAHFQFEVINPNKLSDYIDYAFGGKTLAIDVTGSLTQAQAKLLNSKQHSIQFMSQADIMKRPKPLSPELKSQLTAMLDKVANSPRLSVDEKKEIEELVSASLVEIFGDSILGGRMEGLFITGGGKPFKIPEKGFADIQRLQSPMYAIFSGRGGINQDEIIKRLESVAEDSAKSQSDKMISDIRNYLEAASKGMSVKGFRTFFTPDEATRMLTRFNQILKGNGDARSFVSSMSHRIGYKRSWVHV